LKRSAGGDKIEEIVAEKWQKIVRVDEIHCPSG